MDMPSMGPKTTELMKVLDELVALLERDGETKWRAWIQKAQSRLADSDYSGIQVLLGAYGGMGSFNDLVLGQSFENGIFAWKSGHEQLNNDLEKLREKAWSLATAIKRSL
jgi:hypothetical protein